MTRVLLVFCLLYLPMLFAKDYGVVGKTWVIAEQDFLEYLQQKMKAMEENGQWKAVQSQFKKQVKAHLMRPTPTHLPRAVENKTFLFNPAIEVPHDVLDTTGLVIVKKGTVINPLDRVSLSSTLVFFDGDDKEQVAWVADELKRLTTVKLILTSGSIKVAANYFKQAVYFDLNGFLVNKFEITALPARVAQAQNRLQIKEVKL